jgi:hypothetical protein
MPPPAHEKLNPGAGPPALVVAVATSPAFAYRRQIQ